MNRDKLVITLICLYFILQAFTLEAIMQIILTSCILFIYALPIALIPIPFLYYILYHDSLLPFQLKNPFKNKKIISAEYNDSEKIPIKVVVVQKRNYQQKLIKMILISNLRM